MIADELETSGDNVIIGNRVSIGPHVTIVTTSSPNHSRLQGIVGTTRGRVVVQDDAWIGARVVLLPHVTVGEMSIIGAGAVVTESVPSMSVAVGVPARVVRQLEEIHAT